MHYLTLPDGSVAYGLPGDVVQRHWWTSATITDDHGRRAEVLAVPRNTSTPAVVACAGPATSLTFTTTTPGPVIAYRLTDPRRESAALPLALIPEDLAELPEDDRFHYSADRAEPTTTTEVVRLDSHRPWPIAPDAITPRPELPAGATWSPATVWAAVFGLPSHDHLVPGHLTGFHAAALALITSHPHYLPAGFLGSAPRIEAGVAKRCEFTFHHADGLTRPVKQGRRLQQRPARETIHVDVRVGLDLVGGATLDDAIVNWTARLADVAAQLPMPGLVCAACRGLGFVRPDRTPLPSPAERLADLVGSMAIEVTYDPESDHWTAHLIGDLTGHGASLDVALDDLADQVPDS